MSNNFHSPLPLKYSDYVRSSSIKRVYRRCKQEKCLVGLKYTTNDVDKSTGPITLGIRKNYLNKSKLIKKVRINFVMKSVVKCRVEDIFQFFYV